MLIHCTSSNATTETTSPSCSRSTAAIAAFTALDRRVPRIEPERSMTSERLTGALPALPLPSPFTSTTYCRFDAHGKMLQPTGFTAAKVMATKRQSNLASSTIATTLAISEPASLSTRSVVTSWPSTTIQPRSR